MPQNPAILDRMSEILVKVLADRKIRKNDFEFNIQGLEPKWSNEALHAAVEAEIPRLRDSRNNRLNQGT